MIVQAVYSRSINIKELVLDKSVQMRATLNRIAIADYADAMEAGDEFPPIVVFHRAGGKKYVANGFHRVLVAKKLKLKTIPAEVHDGGKREAIVYAAGANVRHGVRRTNEDKRKAVITFLSDKEWKTWTDSTIAKQCSVSGAMVARYRQYMGEEAGPSPDKDGFRRRKFVDRTGRVRERITDRDPDQEVKLDEKLSGEICPYCGQKMPGQQHRIR